MSSACAGRSRERTQGNPLVAGARLQRGTQHFELKVSTFNCTALGQAKEFLGLTPSHVVLLQEVKVDCMAANDFTVWCASRGWQLLISAAVHKGEAGSLSAGVAIAARSGLGLRRPEQGLSRSHVIDPSRLVAGLLDLPEGRALLVGSAYFHVGQALSPRNKGLLAAWAAVVRRHSPHGCHLLGADFNMPPAVVRASGAPELMAAEVVSASNVKTYIQQAGKTGTNIDYFLIGGDLARGYR